MVVHTLLLDDDALIKILSNPFVSDNNISDFTLCFFFKSERKELGNKSGVCTAASSQ